MVICTTSASNAALFRRNNGWKHDVLARNFCEIFQQEGVVFEVVA